MTTKELLEALWRDYVASTPQAERVHALLAARGETIRSDHIALRTFGAPSIGIDTVARVFEDHGWVAQSDEYRFPAKHVRARHWRHADPAVPKVFISELVVAEMSPGAQATIAALVARAPENFAERADLAWAGRPWHLTHSEYEALRKESEYAAWVAAFGIRVNHFSVDVNALSTFPDLTALNTYLVEHGFTLNRSGGKIKGSREAGLEQSSTRADSIEVAFDDATVRIPSCYYEFAKRYALPSGELFGGFISTSADKIFESTDAGVKTD